jgi:hypothetical protein
MLLEVRDLKQQRENAMVDYLSFNGDEYNLVPWTGTHIAVLTPPKMTVDPAVISRLIGALDDAWEYYSSITGREPNLAKNYDGLGTIAVVDRTCGAGCGYLGSTGVEILRPYFEIGYNELAQNGRFDQIPFYELGRNFWFYGDQLGAIDAFVTGFAVVNRFGSMEAAGVQGAPFGGTDFATFRHKVLTDMAQLYLLDEGTTGIQGLTTNPPANPLNLGAADVAASLFYRIQEDFGSEAYARFWHAMGDLPTASTPQEAISNFLAAARSATGVDYGALFKDGWVLEVGESGNSNIRLDAGGALPIAAFGFDGDDRLNGSSDNDHLFGGAGRDRLKGNGGGDVLVGAVGRDDLDGGSGDDWLGGGPGDDTLFGDKGSDWHVGGPGSDTFLFRGKGKSHQVDTIADFKVGEDRLQIEGGLKVSSLEETDVNGDLVADVVLTLNDGGTIHLLSVNGLANRGELFIV